MKLKTIFLAYRQAETRKRLAAAKDGRFFGIAIRQDKYARVWQKLDKQSRKFEKRILANLGNKKAKPIKKCKHNRIFGDKNLCVCMECRKNPRALHSYRY